MKIQIDTNQKVIRLLESANFAKFVKFAKKLLGEEYDKFTLECTNEVIYWKDPIVLPYSPYYPIPWTWPYTTCGTGNISSFTTVGTNYTDGSWAVVDAIPWDPSQEVHIYNFDIQELEESHKN
jgi:hypothetical protein